MGKPEKAPKASPLPTGTYRAPARAREILCARESFVTPCDWSRAPDKAPRRA